MMNDGQTRVCGFGFLQMFLVTCVVLVFFNDRLSFIDVNVTMKLLMVFFVVVVVTFVNQINAFDHRCQRRKSCCSKQKLDKRKFIAANALNWCVIYWFSCTNHLIYNFLIVRQLILLSARKVFALQHTILKQIWTASIHVFSVLL